MTDAKKVQATYEHPVYLRGISGNLILGEDDAPIVIHAVGDPVFAADGETPIYKVVEHTTLPPLEGDLIEILGRPNFQCSSLANALRLKGQDIPFKSEEEQASVLYLLLSCYLKDKENWRNLVRDDLLSGFVQSNDRMAFGGVQHIGPSCSMITVTIIKREGLDSFPENFNIKAIFKKPYVLEEGIFFDDSAVASQVIVRNLKAGEVFDTELLPEGWMTYDQFFAKLDEQHKA